MDQSLKFAVHTFGCKVNTYDTGLIQKNLNGSGFDISEKPRIHVLNTCAVTGEATKQAIKLIRKLKASDPFCTVVVTGCAAQVDTGSFSNLPGADLVVANSHKSELPNLIRRHLNGTLGEKTFKSNIFKKEDLEAGGGEELSHTRSFLKIQDGCNSFCSYCIIPYARGKSRSISIVDLTKKINELQAQGVQEVVLTGVHIGDYIDVQNGKECKIEDLIETLLLKTKMPRFRLSSLEPVELSDRLIDLYQDDRMCRHFHMSIQAAETDVLKHMKRNYTSQDVRDSLTKIALKIPGSFVGMDVIAGFPTETEEQFQEGYLTLADLPWTKLHVFPYSERSGTRAAALEVSVPWEIRTRRASRLRELSLARFQEQALSEIGSSKKVLILKKPSRGAQGLSRDYWSIKINEPLEKIESLVGQEVLMKTTKYIPAVSKNFDGTLEAIFLENQ